ncbi:MAG: RidA family protein [Cypionkella sp.]|uniref:RidA family protein n=1 Tax=Cypionkella sp. TaxID=2811411 RepID=UPI002ABC364F|nr:RidA family protein [Cypionkella sp.]MDZ4312111.1 RidA family protein [Cypionkella sp.]
MNAMHITPISTPNAPAAAGHYVQAITHAGLVYVSGQLPVAPDGSHHPEADFETQARQAIHNLIAVAAAAGASVEDLLKVTVYIVDVANWPRFNAVYAQMLGNVRPARSVVPVPELHYGYLVEIDAIAACKA